MNNGPSGGWILVGILYYLAIAYVVFFYSGKAWLIGATEPGPEMLTCEYQHATGRLKQNHFRRAMCPRMVDIP